jgi:uncharacterized protein
MNDQIVEFSNLLRRHGIRVSPSENMEALRALELVGIEEPSSFRGALRTTLVKRSMDIRPFEELFELFFLGVGKSVAASDQRLMEQLGLSPKEFWKWLEEVRDLLERWNKNLSPLARALLSGDMGQLERLLRNAKTTSENDPDEEKMSVGAYAQRMVAALDLDRVGQEMEDFMAWAGAGNADAQALERLSRYLDERLKALSQLIRELAEQESKKGGIGSSERRRLDYLMQKSFSYYTEEDIRRMNEVVTRLAQRFKNLLSIRRKRAHRGRFDVKETMRKNLQYGGVPFEIQLDRRKREKPQVIVLCDISDSVLNASRFMLQFVYSLQDLYSKVRSFVFVSEVGEVTRLFEENEIHKAIDMALKGAVIDVYCHSNFGRAFEMFHREHLPSVNSKTTFLIIGDGRNNYNRANDWVLKEIRRRAKQLIWLNPESRLTWGFGDSEMTRYLSHCDVAEECRNIEQLYKVINRIVA